MREYERIETPTDFPAMCVCGSQKAPLVDTHLVKDAYGHVYLCRLCVTRSARVLGLIKGAEHERLERADDELLQAGKEIATRQEQLDEQAATIARHEERLRVQSDYISQLRDDLALKRQQLGQITEMAAT